MLTVGQIIIVEGKVDTGSTPPKILVDTVRTEIKILEPLVDAMPQAQPKPAPNIEALTQPKPDSHVKDFKINSTQPKSNSVQPKPQVNQAPAKPVTSQPVKQVT